MQFEINSKSECLLIAWGEAICHSTTAGENMLLIVNHKPSQVNSIQAYKTLCCLQQIVVIYKFILLLFALTLQNMNQKAVHRIVANFFTAWIRNLTTQLYSWAQLFFVVVVVHISQGQCKQQYTLINQWATTLLAPLLSQSVSYYPRHTFGTAVQPINKLLHFLHMTCTRKNMLHCC